MIYIFTFIISLIFIYIALCFRKNRFFFLLFSAIGICIPCLLAGLRDYSIGTDVNVYVAPLFRAGSYFDSFRSFILNKSSTVNDILYLALAYLCRKVTNNITIFFFMSELLVILPIYKSLLMLNEKKQGILLGLFIFFMFFFNQSLNMARQSIAISFTILSMACLVKGKKVGQWLTFFIAILFHSSAIVTLLLFLYNNILNSNKIDVRIKKISKIIITIIVMLFVLFLPRIVIFLIKIGILNEAHYMDILTRYVIFNINWVNLLFYILIFIYIRLNNKRLSTKFKNWDFFEFMSLLSIIVLQSGTVIKYAERIGYYIFYTILFLVLPQSMPEDLQKMKKNDLLNIFLLMLIFSFYWIFWIIILKYHQTYPFVFRS